MEAASTMPAIAPQHMQALAHANRVRLARADLKRGICAGRISAADVVRRCPWQVETMTLAELLRSQRRWGRTRVRKLLASLQLRETRKVGQLTDRERNLLAKALEAKSAVGNPAWAAGEHRRPAGMDLALRAPTARSAR
jgi:hypothetical protein